MKAHLFNPADYARACCGVAINARHADDCETRVCGWPPIHDEETVPGPAAVGGWAHGEPTYTLRCRRCSEVRGPFIVNSGDAGF